MNLLIAFRNSPFRKLCYAQIFSDLAAWMDISVVAVFMVYYWGVDAYTQASYFITLAVGYFFGSLSSALISDRFSPKKNLILCNIFRIIIMLLYSTAASSSALLIYVFLKTFVSSFYDPGTQIIIRYSFKTEELSIANSISNTITQLIRIIAPMAGGGLLILIKPVNVFIICSFLYAVSTLFLCFLPAYKKSVKFEETSQRTPGLERFFCSLNFIFNNKLLLVAISSTCLLTLSVFICETFYVMLFKHLMLSSTSVGILFAAVGAGGVGGSLLAGRFFNNAAKLITIGLNGLLIGLSILVMALHAAEWIAFNWISFISISFVFGLSSSFFTVIFMTLLQTRTPLEHIGSVSSIANGLEMICMVIGPLFGSLLVAYIGLSAPFFLSGFLCILIALCILFFSKDLECSPNLQNYLVTPSS